MTNSTQFDFSTLAEVKPELDDMLAEISARLGGYLDEPASNAESLKAARSELHRLLGVLKEIHLDGVVAFCTELDTVLDELTVDPQQVSRMHSDVLRHVLSAIAHYLDALANGADNATLRLFPQYQELQQLRGLEMAFELDLFYPNLGVQLPQEVLDALPDGDAACSDAIARIKTLRSKYQQGLLRWMQQNDTPAALQQMQQALDEVMRCVPQDGRRAFWWIASGLLDCLRLDGLPPELNARKLLGRIDQQMRAVADGNVGDVQLVVNEMLYLIGRSHTVSDLVEAIKQVYMLDYYLPELSALPPGEVAQRLALMRDQLQVAEDSWERCAHGDRSASDKFIEYADRLAMQSEKLDRNTLQYLAKKIKVLSPYAIAPEHARLIGMDMAMALLLLERGIGYYGTLDSGFQGQARILFDRMQAIVRQQPEDTRRLAKLVELHCRMERDDVMVTLSNEMLVNLQHVEQGLNAFFSDAAKRDELNGLIRLLSQIQGGLCISFLDQAEQLLVSVQDNVSRFAQGDEIPSPQESQALSDAVGALGKFLQNLSLGQAGDTSVLQAALAGMANLHQETTQVSTVTAEKPQIPTEAQHPLGEDQEMLEVFLEEAQEVLRSMRDNLELCRLHPDSRDPLVNIRRGFHTLKGSGRMVGLTDLGEVAWCVERALNKWLQDNRRGTQSLLNFITGAAQKFAGWVDALNTQGAVSIEAGDLIAAAQQIENGIVPEVAEQPVTPGITPIEPASIAEQPPQPIVEQPAGEPDETTSHSTRRADNARQVAGYVEAKVVIGDISIAPTLFRIASEEARQQAAVLQGCFAKFRESQPAVAQYDFMRAAHTLAGVNRTLGFTSVVELAHALESWLQVRMGKPFNLSDTQTDLLQRTMDALESMVQNICAMRTPSLQSELVRQLLADKDQPGEQIKPVATAVEPVAAEQAGTPANGHDGSATTENERSRVRSLSPTSDETTSHSTRLSKDDSQVVGYPPAGESDEVSLRDVHVKADKRQVRDDVDEQLLPIFLEEADDLCPKIGAGLRAWRDQPHDDQQLQLLKRLLHTLKGSARMAGAMRIGELAHGMEERILAAAKTDQQAEFWDALDSDFDSISGKLENLRTGKIKEAQPSDLLLRASDQSTGIERRAERILTGNMLRVRSDVVDRLVNEAGEISVARSRMETELRAFKEGLLELTGSVARLRKQLREVEIHAESQMQARVSLARDSSEQFDPLEFDRFTRLQELTRFMNESVHDVQTVQQALLKNIDETSAAMSVQSRLNRELQQSLMNVRMVPFASISERLYRIVRQTGKELNKRANLELIGTGVELDRSVLEKMAAPFEHLLRNAIAHGMESASVRAQHGKSPIGEIRLNLRHENNEVVFELSDDGAGLNFAALREKAEVRGLLQPGEVASDDQLAQLIFISGVSTAAEVTEVAGRGIGMDVVRSEIAGLGGRIDVSSKQGLGTSFLIHLPLTLAVTQVLMMRSGDSTYAIPSTMVEQVRQVKSADLAQLYRDRQIEWQGKIYSFHYLPHLLGDAERIPESMPRNPVLMLRSGEQRIALHVDDLQGNHEAVVKNIGPQLSRLPGIAGATVLGNGAVVLILNPAQLAQRIGTAARKVDKVVPEVLHTQPLIMVVDDSLTVRKITTRLLTRAGYQVVTAKDGVDALEQLGEINPSVMLLDVEMPRMDGFELTKQLRRDAKTQSLPIIMITSRTADKHRDYALQLGVNAYLGKPYQEETLLQQIAGFVAVPEASV